MIPSFEDQVNWGLALPFFLAVALLQVAIAPTVSLIGGHPDLLLVLVTGWALIRSPEEAMIAGLPAALLVGLLGSGPVGIPILALMAPIGLSLMLRSGGASPKLPALCAVVALSTLMAIGIDVAIQFLNGASNLVFAGLLPVTLGATILNAVFAAALYVPLSFKRKRKLVRRTRLTLS